MKQDDAAGGGPPPTEARRITVNVVCADLATYPEKVRAGSGQDRSVDAIALSHYLGGRPQFAAKAVDRAISIARKKLDQKEKEVPPGSKEPIEAAEYLLTQLCDRGTIRGELAEFFILPDPRTELEATERGEKTDRLLVIEGLGMPGHFGVPEIVVLARELSWMLGRLGKRHLASLLVGSGFGNTSIPAAVGAWLRGLAVTASSAPVGDTRLLKRVSFVEKDPATALRIDQTIKEALEAERRRLKRRKAEGGLADWGEVVFEHEEFSEQQKQQLRQPVAAEPEAETSTEPEEPIPTCITVVSEGQLYHYGAITRDASIPERDVDYERELIDAVNRGLVVEPDLAQLDPAREQQERLIREALDRQLEEGVFLSRLLLPDDMLGHLMTPEPLVLLLDATTARIHWEMLALPEPTASRVGRRLLEADPQERFLGLSRGLTRQLRTSFAPPPEPPPPPRRTLRVLIIADPASGDKPLQGAAKEADEIEELFLAFNTAYARPGGSRVEVVKLVGAEQATRLNVLRHLMVRGPYDVLHYSGHCAFEENAPEKTGWLFANGAFFTARDLSRIDRIPRFVFSNACESGVTPDRAWDRKVALAPNFAESFFARGVTNFVCTAWPVHDTAGRRFVREFYAWLLGLREQEVSGDDSRHVYIRLESGPAQMYEAMWRARCRIYNTLRGVATWGAYQHYGNPFFRLFSPKMTEWLGRVGLGLKED